MMFIITPQEALTTGPITTGLEPITIPKTFFFEPRTLDFHNKTPEDVAGVGRRAPSAMAHKRSRKQALPKTAKRSGPPAEITEQIDTEQTPGPDHTPPPRD